MKNIKFKLVDIENLEFEILEDAPKGSHFTLKDWTVDDAAIINEYALNKKDEYRAAILKEHNDYINKNWKNMYQYKELMESFDKKELSWKETELKYRSEIELLKQKQDIAIQQAKSEFQSEIDNLKAKEMINLERDKLIKEAHEKEIKRIYETVEQEKRNLSFEKEKAITELNHQMQIQALKLRNEIELEFENKKQTEIAKIATEKETLEKELQNWKGRYEGLTARRSSQTMKTLANEFEDEVQRVLENTFGVFDEIEFQRTTTPVEYLNEKGEKEREMPDFEVVFYDKNDKERTIGKIVIEAKSLQTTKGSKENKDFLKKLESDRKNFGADKAILVTELNPNDDFFIQTDKAYPNIYIIRIDILASLLKLFYLIAKKEAEMENKFNVYKTQTLNKEEILNEFRKFKSALLENQITYLKNGVGDLQKEVNNLSNTVIKMQGIIDSRILSHTRTIENKINQFNIERKIISRLDKIGHFENESNICKLEDIKTETEEAKEKDINEPTTK
ncbi:DUF2130 domain-containing protein [Mycoplasma hafezii]|uniref:DUF2130 domain-containing protein n=1 Tax=Mycoplasma hafezii TaxID=525886 RepID=UPI003CF23351